MLLLSHQITQKQGGKKDAVGPVSLNGFKVIFTLLTIVVVVQVRELNLQKLFLKPCLD